MKRNYNNGTNSNGVALECLLQADCSYICFTYPKSHVIRYLTVAKKRQTKIQQI